MADKLYTVNQWNKNQFAPTWMSNPFGVAFSKPNVIPQVNWSNPQQRAAAVGTTAGLVNGFGQWNANGPFSGNSNTSNSSSPSGMGFLGGMAGGLGSMVGNAVGNAIGGGYSADGSGLVGGLMAGVQSVNTGIPWLDFAKNTVAGAATGIFKRATGVKPNEKNIAAIEQNTLAARNAGNELAGANSSDAVIAASGDMVSGTGFSAGDLYKNGWWTRKGTKKGNAKFAAEQAALAAQTHGLTLGVQGADTALDDEVMGNFAAFGGPLGMAITSPYTGLEAVDNIGDNGMGAIEYGFMKDWLLTKKRQQDKERMNNLEAKSQGTVFDIGGVLQSNGGDFGTGAMHIDAGNSHSENPYGGVQVGVDPEGVPNLVEEGEVIYNDYVYSNRIKCDATTKEKFHFSKKKDITFADAAKKLEGEISERPADPISKAGFKAQMAALAEEQERQKAEMEAERAREAFEALSPEEQVAVMQQTQAPSNLPQLGEATAESAPMEAEGMVPGGEAPGTMGAEKAAAMMQQSGQPVMACGGKVNRYDRGGDMKRLFSKMLGLHTQSDIDEWLKKNNVKDLDWEKALENSAFVSALTKGNPALADAISRGYDFGAYVPDAPGNVTFDNDRGNWDMQTVQGWWGSQDPAWLEVIKNHPELTRDTKLDKKTLESYLSSTDAFKKGTEWLQASPENRLTYLQAIFNNPNAPVRARQYAERFIDANGWKQGAATDYDTIFNNPSGRTANPGTYWKTPIEAVRNAQSMNLVQNANGDWEEVIGDIPAEWTPAGNYSWATPESDFTYNYYTRLGSQYGPENLYGAPWAPGDEGARSTSSPGNASGTTGKAAGTIDERNARRLAEKYAPMLRPEWPRHAGIAGPIVGLGMQALGLGRPDIKSLDKIVENYTNYGPLFVAPRYIGDYLGYRPMDIWAEQNRLNANSRGTERGILNSGASQGAKMAGLLASGYNDQIASGELYRKALEYNDAQLERRAAFNKDTNKTNMAAYNDAQKFNAEIANSDSRYNAQLALQAAAQKNALNADWASGIYGNVAGLFKGISDIGRENAQHNMIARMAADGLFGNLGDSWVGRKYISRI